MKTVDRFDTLPELNVVYECKEFEDMDPTRLIVDGFDLLQMAEPHDRAAIQEFFTVADDWFLQEHI